MKKFLLHTCCAPCSIAIIDELRNKVDPSTGLRTSLTVFFYNPNIYPESEYLKRKAEVVKVCEEWGVSIIDFENPSGPADHLPLTGEELSGVDYDQSSWNQAVKGLESEPEMGARCPVCFTLRLERTAQYASENNFDIFSTSLTSGRNKKAFIINPIGLELAKKYNVEYLEEDWKKTGRQERGRKMVEERGIYRQDYCGCRYSRST